MEPRFCIGCHDHFTGARCRLFHPDYMYDYGAPGAVAPPEEGAEGVAKILAEAAAEAVAGASSAGSPQAREPEPEARGPGPEPESAPALRLKQEGTALFRSGEFAAAAEKFGAAGALEPLERSHPANQSLALLRVATHPAAL